MIPAHLPAPGYGELHDLHVPDRQGLHGVQSGGEGLRPEAKLLIPYDRDYQGERELEYRGERWKVLRSDPYKDWNGVILLVQRKAGNAGDVTPAPVTTTGAQEVG